MRQGQRLGNYGCKWLDHTEDSFTRIPFAICVSIIEICSSTHSSHRSGVTREAKNSWDVKERTQHVVIKGVETPTSRRRIQQILGRQSTMNVHRVRQQAYL